MKSGERRVLRDGLGWTARTTRKERAMLDHTGFVVSDLGRAKRFYDAIARPLGLATKDQGKESFLLGRGPGQVPYLWIGTLRPSYWAPGSKPGINQMHVAFAA